MSTNFYIYASRDCIAKKTGFEFTQTREIDVWQTPTGITREILASDNPLQAYKDWVLSVSKEEEEPVFEDVYPFKKIGTQMVHPGKEHIKNLDEELDCYKDWDITYEAC